MALNICLHLQCVTSTFKEEITFNTGRVWGKMFISCLWFQGCMETAHGHKIVTVDQWYLLLEFVTCLAFPLVGKNTDDWITGSPCDLDHLGFKGLHMLQKSLHGLSCVNYGLREGKSKGRGERWRGRDMGCLSAFKEEENNTEIFRSFTAFQMKYSPCCIVGYFFILSLVLLL